MAGQKQTFATEILCRMKRRLVVCRIALAISLAANVALAAMLFMN